MLLEVQEIEKSYGSHRVLDGVSFTADSGEVVGILGANGAGKTTLLRLVTRLLMPDSGTLLFDGHPLLLRTAQRTFACRCRACCT